MKTFSFLTIFVFTAILTNCQVLTNNPALSVFSSVSTKTYTDTRDNHVYKTIKIREQTWFAENIDFNMPESWYYHDTLLNIIDSCRLFSWNAAMHACPEGWHLPSDSEWCVLEAYLDDRYSISDTIWRELGYRGYDAGKKLKSLLSVRDDKQRNSRKLSGYRSACGLFNQSGKEESFWTSTEIDSTYKWFHGVNVGYDGAYRAFCHKKYGFSVRCVKNK